MFANYSDTFLAFLDRSLPLIPPSRPPSLRLPMGEGPGVEGSCHYILQSSIIRDAALTPVGPKIEVLLALNLPISRSSRLGRGAASTKPADSSPQIIWDQLRGLLENGQGGY
jgi:hypothetical protein